jgi:hypothetical protein
LLNMVLGPIVSAMRAPREYLEFVYTKSFVSTAKGLLSDDDLRVLEQTLIENPRAGTVERGTGGVRKVRLGLEAEP